MDFKEKGIYTVHEFTRVIKTILTDGMLNDVWIRGEISNYTNHSSGHRYFTLKDKNSQLQCVMFRWYGQNMRFELEHGMKVIVLGDIDLYEQKGQYQLKVRAARPDGVGELYKAYEQLKNKLALEGLFSPEHKKTLPPFPGKIGVATSDTGAAIHDILTILKRRYPVNVKFFPTIVQGEYAAGSIIRSIEVLNKTDVDVIILGRGGGSIEDLWAFNEEAVARAIFNSKVPVISAVGHETDYTISDFVADVRAPTPSAAAGIAVPDRQELFSNIIRLNGSLLGNMEYCINEKLSRVAELDKRVDPVLFMDNLDEHIRHIGELTGRQEMGIKRIIEVKNALFNARAGMLDAVSPLGTLVRGYSIVMTLPDMRLISSIKEVEENDNVRIIVTDGKINCCVKDKEVCKW
ncbi:MAG: exodeoxyribonuclease VII large subunit [Candidatus Methanoperedenaceae archaeon]|nr:exodeoxyribonuclease VII large subunit [Candidatus Methanoperedenaceae archaeon]MDW7727106.1 exodeoxyribonuclease VII large subunit [Candidatus Methanoperedens sp.]